MLLAEATLYLSEDPAVPDDHNLDTATTTTTTNTPASTIADSFAQLIVYALFLAGFWMLQCKSPEEALAWAQRVPNPMNEDGTIELRRVFEMDDLPQGVNCGPATA